MPRYSDERRRAVVAKLLPPYNQSVEEVARQEGRVEKTVQQYQKCFFALFASCSVEYDF